MELFIVILTVKPSSTVAPQSEVQVHPFGVVVSGSATSFGAFSSFALPDEKGHPRYRILNHVNGRL